MATLARWGALAGALGGLAAAHGYARYGPRSYRAEFRRWCAAALADAPDPGPALGEADLARLPDPVAGYLRIGGAVGLPRLTAVHARFHGRIRSGPGDRWMTFRGEQLNTTGPRYDRFFRMDASMFALPVDVLHVFTGDTASMRVSLCSLLPLVDAASPEVARAETVTVFNDLCVLAPAALVDAPVDWTVLGERRVRGSFTRGPHTVAAELRFDREGWLAEFVAEDRLRYRSGGTRRPGFEPQRWSTPVGEYRHFGARVLSSRGEARWHDPAGEFSYLDLWLDDVTSEGGAAAGQRLAGGATAGR
ncbi:MAG TPA: DUF6544 family protein [Jatrophihabitans sp.]|nr:DUF6544 family protein [Jatrophihabitans sp.]